jgi:hypothetical protein
MEVSADEVLNRVQRLCGSRCGHCFRGNDDEGLLPTRPDSPSNHPEEPIEAARLGRGWHRFGTESCWRKAKFSRRRLRCEQKRRTSVPVLNLTNRNMASTYTRTLVRPEQLCY